jgi:YfiH family protein
MEGDFIKFSNLNEFPELVQGVSTRALGNMKMLVADPKVIKNRENFTKILGIDLNSIVVTENVHGNKIAIVGKGECGRGALNTLESIPGVDGLVTREPNVNLMITVADCLPLVAYDPILRIVGIAHAGWRGILAGVGAALVNEFKVLGSKPENLVMGIGPGICQKHFIVKNDILTKFKEIYPKATFIRNHDGYVDLKASLTEQLLKNGVTKYNLEVAKECTVCNNYYFGSFRSEGDKAVYQAVVIGLRR